MRKLHHKEGNLPFELRILHLFPLLASVIFCTLNIEKGQILVLYVILWSYLKRCDITVLRAQVEIGLIVDQTFLHTFELADLIRLFPKNARISYDA